MIDHILGRPSQRLKSLQVLLVLIAWTGYLVKGNRHGPYVVRRISRRTSGKLTAWQTFCMTLTGLYLLKNMDKLLGLGGLSAFLHLLMLAPEPLARLYSRSFFRATWFATAMDAGFFTALPIRRKWIRDIASILFSVYYLVFAEAADEKVRKVRATITVEQIRVSWEKQVRNPYIRIATMINAGRIRCLKEVTIPRDGAEPVMAWLYWNGTESELAACDKLVLSITGGGAVSMTPRCHDEYLIPWTKRLGVPILSINYRFALS